MKIYEINELGKLKGITALVLESQPFHLPSEKARWRVAVSDLEAVILLQNNPNAIHITDKGRTTGWYQNLLNSQSEYGIKNVKVFEAMLPPSLRYIAQTIKRAKIRGELPTTLWADILLKAELWNGIE